MLLPLLEKPRNAELTGTAASLSDDYDFLQSVNREPEDRIVVVAEIEHSFMIESSRILRSITRVADDEQIRFRRGRGNAGDRNVVVRVDADAVGELVTAEVGEHLAVVVERRVRIAVGARIEATVQVHARERDAEIVVGGSA